MATWSFLPQVIVRGTGFPVELLERLRFSGTVRLFEQVADAEAAIRASAGEVIPLIRDAVVVAKADGDTAALRVLSDIRGRVTRLLPTRAAVDVLAGRLDEWNQALAERDALLDKARETFAAELTERRRRLRAIVGDELVKDALLLCSRDIRAAVERYHDAWPERRTSSVRKLERRLVSYLQRLCAKNETQSFFGPLNYGRLDPAATDNLTIRRSPDRIAARESFPSQWTAERLALRIAEDPASHPLLQPRRATWCRLDGDELVFPLGDDTYRLEPADLVLFQAADGRRTVAELADDLGEPWPETWQRVRRLSRKRALVLGPIIPPDLPDPLAWLIDWLDRFPPGAPPRDRWEPELRSLHAAIRSFAHSPVEDRRELLADIEAQVVTLCEADARRHGGRMYADRAPLFEECRGDLAEFVIGGDLHRVITERLAPVLDLATTFGIAEQHRDHAAAVALVRRHGGDEMPLLGYLAALAREPVHHGPHPEFDRLLDTLDALVADHTEGNVARIPGDALPTGGAPGRYLVTSVDLMLRARDVEDVRAGRFELVLGEMHPQALSWVFPSAHMLEPDLRAELGAGLAAGIAAQPDAGLAARFVHTRSNKIFPYPLPGHVVELRPRAAFADAVPAAEVTVRAGDGEVGCWSPSTGELRFYPPLRRRSGQLDPVASLSFPSVHLPRIGLGTHVPRVEVDGVVVQRERWDLPADTLGVTAKDDFELFHSVWRTARDLGLPDQVYVRVPQEPKPVFVDFGNAFLVELLAHLGRLSTGMTVSEAFPGTEGAWLDDAAGRFHCELRLIVVGGPQ
ncbi:lantibiotic dehydratase [Saccharothrix sp. NRRL B-16314]|uniref:lantibiotic dehydratase n=1 Tax=Saccharothrix sp. NRRL B-16314 TaxID=1463825 RepID=UPI000526D32D|nr:lantibiotic dehydratase [Saccharothrix sp. NRRL B-16314]